MKKVIVCVCFIFLIVRVSHAQSDWINYKVDNKLSIEVPSQPEEADQFSVVSTGKDSLVCAITKIDMQKTSGVDSVTLAQLAPTTDFAEVIKTGMMQTLKDYNLGKVRIGKWNGYYAYYVDGINDLEKVKSYSFMILIGTNLYSFSVVMPIDQDAGRKDYFFASLKLNR